MIQIKDRSFSVVKDGEEKIEFHFIADEFGIIFSDTPVEITNEDGTLYQNLEWLMKQNYLFSHPYASKDENHLLWLSDQSVDLEDAEEVKRVSRMLIERKDDSFTCSCLNPFLNEMGVKCRDFVVCFSPCGNGYYTKNKETGRMLQDEVVMVFQNTLQGINMNQKKVYQKRREFNGN